MKAVQNNIFIFIIIILAITTPDTVAQSETKFRKLRTVIANRFSRLKRTVSQNSEPDAIAAGLALATVIFVPGAWYQARFKKKKSKHKKPDQSFREVMNEEINEPNNDSVLKTMAKRDGSFLGTSQNQQPKSPDITLPDKTCEKELKSPDANTNKSTEEKLHDWEELKVIVRKKGNQKNDNKATIMFKKSKENELFRQGAKLQIENSRKKKNYERLVSYYTTLRNLNMSGH